jgi:hypothetical protein
VRVNAEFDQQAVIRLGDWKWVPSPAGGLEWCMLDRIGDEVARAHLWCGLRPTPVFRPIARVAVKSSLSSKVRFLTKAV